MYVIKHTHVCIQSQRKANTSFLGVTKIKHLFSKIIIFVYLIIPEL